MKFLTVGALSVLALTVALSACANADTTGTPITLAPQTAPAESFESLTARIINGDAEPHDLSVETRTTASGMIGQPVYNADKKKIATLKDVILDSTGEARLVIVSDGGFMGIGDKLAAFDYGLITQQNEKGDVIMPLSADVIGKVAAFSYDPKEASDKVQAIPQDGYSVVELLKGKLIDPASTALGNIDNITFRNGQASQVIVSFDDKDGPGGHQSAALDYADLTLAKAGNGALNFRMNDMQTGQFKQYMTTTAE